MTVTLVKKVTFDPVTEYQYMLAWMQENDMTEWVKHESTTGITFVHETTTFFYATEYARDGRI